MLGAGTFTWKEGHKNLERRMARKNCRDVSPLEILV